MHKNMASLTETIQMPNAVERCSYNVSTGQKSAQATESTRNPLFYFQFTINPKCQKTPHQTKGGGEETIITGSEPSRQKEQYKEAVFQSGLGFRVELMSEAKSELEIGCGFDNV